MDNPLVELVGAGADVPCIDGTQRPYRDLDCAASTPAMRQVAQRVEEFLPWYSSVHRGAGYKSRAATAAYEDARRAILDFAHRPSGDPDHPDGGDVAVICRNTTEAINHLAYRLELDPDDVVVTTVVEHHANLLPWARVAQRRWVECDTRGTFTTDDVATALDQHPKPKLLAVTGASNVTGWLPDLAGICAAAHDRGIPTLVDAAQLAPHRPLPDAPDYVVFSGHKLYAPYGSGALIGPRATFDHGDPFLAGGGAVDLVDLDEVIWTSPPEREEAGSPNVVGAVAMAAALRQLEQLGWDAAIDGVTLLGPSTDTDTLAVAAFTVEGQHHALVAARLSAEHGIGVRHGCFCAHPYLMRLLGLGHEEVAAFREQVMRGDRRQIPGAVRASCGLGTTAADVDALLAAVTTLVGNPEPPVTYTQDPVTGDFWPDGPTAVEGWGDADRPAGAACARG
jgi:selenocysteine lyase/cysteine desulfurase